MNPVGPLGPGAIVSGHYRIVRALSEGGMGAVFVAEHVTTRKQRALKVMRGELLGDASLRERFVQEAQIGGRIESEHVVEVVDAGFDERLQMPWFAMELLEGESLADRIARGPLPVPEALEVFQQLSHGLAAVHRVGVVHRDLKPENVFIARARRVGAPFTVKLLDLGIAKVVAEAKATRLATAAIGTPLWMAPEQTELSSRIGPPTDVWALGLIAFRALTGRHYWREAYRNAHNVTAILREMLLSPIDPASQRAHELGAAHLLPPGFDAWFARCVEREPSSRFADASRAFAALAPVLAPPPPLPTTTQPAPAWSSGAPVGTTAPQATPPGVHLDPAPELAPRPTQPPARRQKASGIPAFLLGLGSVVALGGLALLALRGRDEAQAGAVKNEPIAAPQAPRNRWVRVVGVKKGVVLGLEKETASPRMRGFRPSRKVTPPFADFEIQQHEVTWSELDELLADEKGKKLVKPKGRPTEPEKREALPVTGVAWATASAYCKHLGGNLPTEEQWELATRGKELRRFAWGDANLDLHGTRVLVGGKASVLPVMTSEQDKTPGNEPIYDLMGNAQEWTLDVYRDDFAEQDEGWAQEKGVTFRAVRGLPLGAPADPGLLSLLTAAHREPACATGACAPGSTATTGDDAVTLVRVAFSSAAPLEGGAARPLLTKALGDAKAAMVACADKTPDDRGALLQIEYALPLKKVPVCRASDGYDDPIECCSGKVCDHAPHRLVKYDPPKVTVSIPTDAQASTTATCAKGALEKKLAMVPWPEAQDEWTATVALSRYERKPPDGLPFIGFRCVRAPHKADD